MITELSTLPTRPPGHVQALLGKEGLGTEATLQGASQPHHAGSLEVPV